MADPHESRPTPLGIYDRPSEGRISSIEVIALVLSGLWLLGADEPGREHSLADLRALALRKGVAAALVISPPRSDIREAYAVSDLVLQLSAKPEAFGRTVVEALSIGRPVLGWDHGGAGELLRGLYPAGLVPLGDAAALAATARRLLCAPAPLPVTIPQTLAAMQSATLELYDHLVDN